MSHRHLFPEFMRGRPIHECLQRFHILPMENKDEVLEQLRAEAVDEGNAEWVDSYAWCHIVRQQDEWDFLLKNDTDAYEKAMAVLFEQQVDWMIAVESLKFLHERANAYNYEGYYGRILGVLSRFGLNEDADWLCKIAHFAHDEHTMTVDAQERKARYDADPDYNPFKDLEEGFQ